MKLIKMFTSILLAGIASASIANVTIKYDDRVNVLAVNQEKPDAKKEGLFSSTKTIALPNGENQVVFRYELIFENGVEQQLVNSDVIIARFNATDANLEFKMPNFRDADIARENLSPLTWSLVDQDGRVIEHVEDKLVRPGVQFGRNFPREAQEYNQEGGVAAVTSLVPSLSAALAPEANVSLQAPDLVNESPVSVSTPTAPTSPSDKTQQASNTAEEMLHFWYEKADAETKARFKAFINQP